MGLPDDLLREFGTAYVDEKAPANAIRVGLAAAGALQRDGRPQDALDVAARAIRLATGLADHRSVALAGELAGMALRDLGRGAHAAAAFEAALDAVRAWEDDTEDSASAELFEEQVQQAARLAVSTAMEVAPTRPDRGVALATYATQRIAVQLAVDPASGGNVFSELSRAWLFLARMHAQRFPTLAELLARFAVAATQHAPSAAFVGARPPDSAVALAAHRQEAAELSVALGGSGAAAALQWRCVLLTADHVAVAHPLKGRIAKPRAAVEVRGDVGLLATVVIHPPHDGRARLERVLPA